jgi:hypothetical protein
MRVRRLRSDSEVCPHCAKTIGALDHFCPKCGGPVTAIASTDPLGQTYSFGWIVRSAMDWPRPAGVLGVWLIFGPQALILALSLLYFVISVTTDETWHSELLVLAKSIMLVIVLCVCPLMLYSAILWKTTNHYIKSRLSKSVDVEADKEAGLSDDDEDATGVSTDLQATSEELETTEPESSPEAIDDDHASETTAGEDAATDGGDSNDRPSTSPEAGKKDDEAGNGRA